MGILMRRHFRGPVSEEAVMPHTALVNYHVHCSETQAFHIDADGVVGGIISPELVETEVPLRDLRGHEADVTYTRDGIPFATTPTKVQSFGDGSEWQAVYDSELPALLTREVGVR